MADIRFSLSIELGDSEMSDQVALGDALETVANRIQTAGFEGDVEGVVRDVNGDIFGRWELEKSDPAEPEPLDWADRGDMRHEHDPSL